MTDLLAPISAGELFDKISILLIKADRIDDASKLQNVNVELTLLQGIARRHFGAPSSNLEVLLTELRRINEAIWDAENVVRECDRTGRFDETFITTARTTYRNNDSRARVKREINIILGSVIMEEKSHARPAGA